MKIPKESAVGLTLFHIITMHHHLEKEPESFKSSCFFFSLQCGKNCYSLLSGSSLQIIVPQVSPHESILEICIFLHSEREV